MDPILTNKMMSKPKPSVKQLPPSMAVNERMNTENRNRNKNKRERRRRNKRERSNLGARPIEAAAVSYSNRQSFPNKGSNKSRRITSSELVGSIVGSTAFNSSQKFSINPGLAASFPWLAPIAAQWQQYCFHKLQYRYVTRSSTASTGSIYLSPDYNPKETPPTTEQQASNTQDAVEDVIWKTVICVLDPKAMFPFGPRKQIRSTNVSGDVSLYDAGRMFVCVTGESSTAEIGKLWVDYDVELFVPQNSPASYLSPTGVSQYTISGATQVMVTGVQEVAVFDSTGVYDPLNIGSCVAGVFTPPAGCYYVTTNLAFRDSISEANTFTTILRVNGAAVSPLAFDVCAAAGATTFKTQNYNWIVPCSGTTTIDIVVEMTGANGSLGLYGNSDSQIFFRLA